VLLGLLSPTSASEKAIVFEVPSVQSAIEKPVHWQNRPVVLGFRGDAEFSHPPCSTVVP
jgi:hypothetical protein